MGCPLSVGLVVPCYNESERLQAWEFLRFIRGHLWIRFYFVDDGSTDATFERLTSIRAAAPQAVTVLRMPQNVGKAEAVRHGLRVAAVAQHDVVGFWDADLAAPLGELVPMRDALARGGHAMVWGARRRLLGRKIRRRRRRGALGWCFSVAASLLLGTPCCDTQCGAKLFRNDAALRRVLDRPFLSRWIFDAELLARYQAAVGRRSLRALLYEYPLDEWHDVAGSKLRPRDFLRAAGELIRLAWCDHGSRLGESAEPGVFDGERRAA